MKERERWKNERDGNARVGRKEKLKLPLGCFCLKCTLRVNLFEI